jgi:hypothetical protein
VISVPTEQLLYILYNRLWAHHASTAPGCTLLSLLVKFVSIRTFADPTKNDRLQARFSIDKHNLGFTGDQFEDWRDRLECYLKARNLNECLAEDNIKGQKEALVSHILRESRSSNRYSSKQHTFQASGRKSRPDGPRAR